MKTFIMPVLIMVTGFFLFWGCEDDSSDSGEGSPKIIELIADPDSLETGSSASLSCQATGENGDPLVYQWQASGGTLLGTGSTVTWKAPDEIGRFIVTCTVKDNKDRKDQGTLELLVFSLKETTGTMDCRCGPLDVLGIGLYDTQVEVSEKDSLIILASGDFFNGLMMVEDPNGFINIVRPGDIGVVIGIASNCLVGSIGTSFSGEALLDDGLDIHPRTGMSGTDYEYPGLFGPGFVGSEFHTRIPQEISGNIYLAINDFPLSDNDGQFSLTIQVLVLP